MSLGFYDELRLNRNSRAFFTSDFIFKNIHIDISKTRLIRGVLAIGAHTFHPWSRDNFLRDFMLASPTCSISISVGDKMDIKYINRISAFTMLAPHRVHIHVGSVRMSLWAKEQKPNLKVRNLFRTPLTVLNKVSLFYVNENALTCNCNIKQATVRQGCPGKGTNLKWTTYKPKLVFYPKTCPRSIKNNPVSIVLGYACRESNVSFYSILCIMQAKDLEGCHIRYSYLPFSKVQNLAFVYIFSVRTKTTLIKIASAFVIRPYYK